MISLFKLLIFLNGVYSLFFLSLIGSGSLRAKFDLSEGPSKPTTLAVQFISEGSTLSGVDIELVGSGYRLSLVKKRFATGKEHRVKLQWWTICVSLLNVICYSDRLCSCHCFEISEMQLVAIRSILCVSPMFASFCTLSVVVCYVNATILY